MPPHRIAWLESRRPVFASFPAPLGRLEYEPSISVAAYRKSSPYFSTKRLLSPMSLFSLGGSGSRCGVSAPLENVSATRAAGIGLNASGLDSIAAMTTTGSSRMYLPNRLPGRRPYLNSPRTKTQ